MGLSAYEMSSHLRLIVALAVAYEVVLSGTALVYGWSWLRRHRRSAGFVSRHRRDRIRPVGTVGRAG